MIATAHTYAGMKTINGVASDLQVAAKPGQRVRVRVINTDNGPIETWADTPFQVLAVDGYQVNAPTDVTDRSVTITAGGRADLGVTMPSDGSGRTRAGVEGHCRPAGCRRSASTAAAGNRTRSTELRKSDRAGASTQRRPTGVSTTRSGADQASSVVGPASGGRSTGTSIPTCRCTW